MDLAHLGFGTNSVDAAPLTERGGSISDNSAAHNWLKGNAGRFGFTGINLEAWHWNWLN